MPHQSINHTGFNLLYLPLSFMRNWKRSSSTKSFDPSLVCMHYPFVSSLVLGLALFFISFPFSSHCYHSPSHHSMQLLVSENKPSSVIAELVGFYRQTMGQIWKYSHEVSSKCVIRNAIHYVIKYLWVIDVRFVAKCYASDNGRKSSLNKRNVTKMSALLSIKHCLNNLR
jgi:hypothetical protein